MKFRGLVYALLGLLLLCAFSVRGREVAPLEPRQSDTASRFGLYTEAVKRLAIYGDTVAALRLTNEALALDATYAPALHLRSRLERDPAKAWEAARSATESDPDNLFYTRSAGETAIRVNRLKEAIVYYDRLAARSIEPDHYRILSLLYDFSGQGDKALATLDSAEVRFGRVEHLTHVRYQLMLKNGMVERVIAEAERDVETSPHNVENYLILAHLYVESKRDSLAEVTYKRALAQNNNDPKLLLDYAMLLTRTNRSVQSLQLYHRFFALPTVEAERKLDLFRILVRNQHLFENYKTAYEGFLGSMFALHPNNDEVLETYISFLVLMEQADKAAAVLKQRLATQATPKKEILTDISQLERLLNRPDSATHYVVRAIKHYPQDAELHLRHGWLLHEQGRDAEAVAALKEALPIAESDSVRCVVWCQIGDTESALHNVKQASKAYDKALRLDADNSTALNNYAYMLANEGVRLKAAEKMALRATELSKDNATFLDTLAWVYYKLGDYPTAKRYMQLALSFDKRSSAELALHYGDILDAMGEGFMAQTYWKKALERGGNAQEIERRIEAQKSRKTSGAQSNTNKK